MEGYVTEEQQVEALKKWWAQNGKSVIAVVIIALAGFFGGRAWFDHKHRTAETASITYQNMQFASQRQDVVAVTKLGNELVTSFGSTPYAAMASLMMARINLQQGKHDAAIAHLKWVLTNSSEEGVHHLARIRLAGVLLDQGKADEALATLDVKEQGNYVALYENVRGDSYTAKADKDAAREAYLKALLSMPADSPLRPLVQMKLDDLGKPGPQQSGETKS